MKNTFDPLDMAKKRIIMPKYWLIQIFPTETQREK